MYSACANSAAWVLYCNVSVAIMQLASLPPVLNIQRVGIYLRLSKC